MKKYANKKDFIEKNLNEATFVLQDPEVILGACWDLWEGKKKKVPRADIDRVVSIFNDIRSRYREKSGIKSKRTVNANDSERKQIEKRLAEGATVEDALLVMEYKFHEWWDAPPFRDGQAPPRVHLNFATLFRPSNFPKYLLAAGDWMDAEEKKNRIRNQSTTNAVSRKYLRP